MTNNSAPGLALMASALCLFGALTIVAWQQDAAREATALKKLTPSTYATGLHTSF